MDHYLLVVVLLVDYMLEERLYFLHVGVAAVHLTEAIADLVFEKLRARLAVEGANEGIDCLNFLEGFDAEQTVDSVGDWCILIGEYLLVFLQAFEVNCDHDLWLKNG